MSEQSIQRLRAKPVVWSVAGSDNSGGAGIQADNLTFHDFSVHGCNIVTALTAQNSIGVSEVVCVTGELFDRQWDDIVHEYPPAVIKLGMLGNATIVQALANKLTKNLVPVVCDPVLRASSGGGLLEDSALYQQLLPFIDVLTPNQQEFSALFNVDISTPELLEKQALAVALKLNVQLIVTGGESHFHDGKCTSDYASDLCVIDKQLFWLHSPKVATNNTHGTGCSFSSAIASALATGHSMLDACVLAKAYINQGLCAHSVFATTHKGPLQHVGFPAHIDTLPIVTSGFNIQKIRYPRIDALNLGVYPVVDSIEWLERCLREGVKTIQLRVKNLPAEVLDTMIGQAAELGRKFSARLFINDYWQLAIKHKAYGVHLGQEDLDTADVQAIADAGLYVGISTHSWFEIARAHSLQPGYIAIGPVYATTTKVMPFAPQGLEQLQQWVKFIDGVYPLVAIGGIDLLNAKDVIATGVGSVAMVRAVTEAPDYRQALNQFAQWMNE